MFLTNVAVGPPPPPLPPPLKALSHNHTSPINTVEPAKMQNGQNGPNEIPKMKGNMNGNGNAAANDNDSDEIDSDCGLEVVEEPTLRPSELVRGNHNRTMSTISGELLDCE